MLFGITRKSLINFSAIFFIVAAGAAFVDLLTLPWALAQMTDDGHGHVHGEIATSTPADPEQRLYVMIGVGVIFVLLVAWFIWSKQKSV